MIQMQIENDPLNGVAYQVLYARTLPANCVTRERQAEIKNEFAEVRAWAATQDASVRSAYEWAADRITEQVENRLQTDELNRKINEAAKTMPIPPRKAPAVPPLETTMTDPAIIEALAKDPPQ